MKIAYFAPIYYYDLKQRPQHIAELLAETNEVYYIEPTISFMRYLLKGGDSYKGRKKQISSNLNVIQANGCLTGHISIQALDFLHLNVISEYIQLHKVLDQCDVIWVGYPGWYDLIYRYAGRKRIIYDKMDDHIAMAYNRLLRKLMIKVEPKLINVADDIIVSCEIFYEEIKKQKDNVYLIRNAVPKDLCVFQNEKKEVCSSGKVFGYFGTVGEWFDQEAIRVILRANPMNRIIIVGKSLIDPIEDNRVEYVDQVVKKDLYKYVQRFDVCIYPFRKNAFLDTINPVKIYEYLAFNKPVIAVASKETMPLEKYCHLYHNYEELKMLCDKDLTLPFYEEGEYNRFLKANCWEKRVEHINQILASSSR